MKKLFGVVGSIIVVIAFLIAMGVGKMVGRGVADVVLSPNTDELLSKASLKINATLPVMVDSETRLDSTEPGQDSSLKYFYTLVNYSSAALDPKAIENSTPQIISNACSIAQMRKLLALGVTAIYVYRANDGVEVGRVKVSQNTCAQSQLPPSVAIAQPGQSTQPYQPQDTRVDTSQIERQNTPAPQADPVVAQSQFSAYRDTAHNRRCREQYNKATGSISNSLPIGDYVNLRDKYQEKLDKCLR